MCFITIAYFLPPSLNNPQESKTYVHNCPNALNCTLEVKRKLTNEPSHAILHYLYFFSFKQLDVFVLHSAE